MRALLSVYDKTGLVDFAHAACTTSASSWCRAAAPPGRSPTPASPSRRSRRSPASPEMLDHRVVTLHPKIHGGILADLRQGLAPRRPRDPRHPAVRPRRVEPLPVRERPGHRAHRHRWPRDGARGGEEPRVGRHRHEPDAVRRGARRAARRRRARRDATRRALALEAFASTAAYDAAIVEWLSGGRRPCCRGTSCSRSSAPTRRCATARTRTRSGARYRLAAPRAGGTASRSTAVSRSATSTTTTPTPRGSRCTTSVTARRCAIIKHANPCGVAVADDLATAYRRALECDERSAFGGIVALNRPIDDATVGADGRRPAGRRGDRARLRGRLARRAEEEAQEHPAARGARARRADAGLPPDLRRLPRADRRRTSRPAATTGGSSPRSAPTAEQWADAELAWRICGHVKSNSIVLVKDGQAVGIGAGQQNRVEAGEIAAKKAAGPRGRRRVRVGRVLPVPRRRRGGRVRRRRGGRAARRLDERRGDHRPGPTSSASRWCSPANGTSCTDGCRDDARARRSRTRCSRISCRASRSCARRAPARARHAPRRRRLRERGLHPASSRRKAAELGCTLAARPPARRRDPGRRARGDPRVQRRPGRRRLSSSSTRRRRRSTTRPRCSRSTRTRTSTGCTR